LDNFWTSFYNIPKDTFVDCKINNNPAIRIYIIYEGWKSVHDIKKELSVQVKRDDNIAFEVFNKKITAYSPRGTLGNIVSITTSDVSGNEYDLDCFA